MEVLFGIFLFFVIVYYGFRFFLRYALPWLISRFVRNQQEKYQNRNNPYSSGPEGEVKVRKPGRKKKKNDDGFGEYVDFEEVKE